MAATDEVGVTNKLPLPEPPPAEVVVATILPVESVARMDEVTFAMIVDELNVAVELKVAPPVKVCRAVQVGAMDCERAGAASERIKVFAVPLCVERSTFVDGFAPVGMVVDGADIVSVLPENVAPESVVLCTLPLLSAERSVFVATAKIVDELKVAVELKICAAVHVTDEAEVTKPGFMKFMVTLPVAFVLEVRLFPEVIADT